MANRDRRKLKFADNILANGEGKGPYGFMAQTANGTAFCDGPGNNQRYDFSSDSAKRGGRAEKRGPWANGNRSGE